MLKTEATASELNLVAAGTVFEGKLRTPGSIRIDGKIIGEVTATQNIAVGNSGEVEGNITAKNVTIGGKIKGLAVAQEKLVFETKAVVRGDVRTAKLVIEEGAVFDGKCMMSEKVAVPNVVELKPDAHKAENR
ncbi:MAG TPA: polymer-forming cytoskeletal protein [Bacteroidota bacterium]|jgi:cytoskeletal protein CcmA (bactofilin family)|nr:polymer-forming cytoskeletal protein [Bacteroidota bacterium]